MGLGQCDPASGDGTNSPERVAEADSVQYGPVAAVGKVPGTSPECYASIRLMEAVAWRVRCGFSISAKRT